MLSFIDRTIRTGGGFAILVQNSLSASRLSLRLTPHQLIFRWLLLKLKLVVTLLLFVVYTILWVL